ncbi:MAG: hypothetical protein V7785_01060 [Bermanella sp.]
MFNRVNDIICYLIMLLINVFAYLAEYKGLKLYRSLNDNIVIAVIGAAMGFIEVLIVPKFHGNGSVLKNEGAVTAAKIKAFFMASPKMCCYIKS